MISKFFIVIVDYLPDPRSEDFEALSSRDIRSIKRLKINLDLALELRTP